MAGHFFAKFLDRTYGYALQISPRTALALSRLGPRANWGFQASSSGELETPDDKNGTLSINPVGSNSRKKVGLLNAKNPGEISIP